MAIGPYGMGGPVLPGTNPAGMVRPPAQLGAQYGANAVNANLPASTLTRPGANTPAPRMNLGGGPGISEVASTGGYGTRTQFAPSKLDLVNALPGVMSARNAYITQGGLASQNYATNLRDLAVTFGDPTAFGNVLGLPTGQAAPLQTSPTNFFTDVSSNAQRAAPTASPWQGWLAGIDPTVARAARTATVLPGGGIG